MMDVMAPGNAIHDLYLMIIIIPRTERVVVTLHQDANETEHDIARGLVLGDGGGFQEHVDWACE